MQGLTNDRINDHYSPLSSEPLHNGQSGAPRYLLLDDLSPRLNAGARNKAFPLTDPGSESNTDIQLDLPPNASRFVPDNDKPVTPLALPRPRYCTTGPAFTTTVVGSLVAGITAGFARDTPALLALNIPAGIAALTSIGIQNYYDSCDGKCHFLVASMAFGFGALFSFGWTNGWLGPINTVPDDHRDPFIP